VSVAAIGRGYTEEDDCNDEDLAISNDEVDLHGDAAESFSFSSLVDPLDDSNEVLNNPVTKESVVTVESLDMTWFNTHSVGNLRHTLISFRPQSV
jgi:hypothetical protein